ncbi:ABC transporter permease [Sulfurimonas sp. SWIR-19]|uniref:MlaE family ABC transporter permease n=1 Tax=Sulfurimonas sp. SWIR-19 TaxID=2878390 RepID=UPI001CF3B44C|nr:ABC transporter permease [Sulfurimonas sp. SWIR-19]UCN00956.1 ABC transporter permease [Sulfurimonas sp. SWIR-19]
MPENLLCTTIEKESISLEFSGELTLYNLHQAQESIAKIGLSNFKKITVDLRDASYLDTAFALFLADLQEEYHAKIESANTNFLHTLALTKEHKKKLDKKYKPPKENILEYVGKTFYRSYLSFVSFMEFIGKVFISFLLYFKSVKNIRFKEIAFEINESALRALGIVALTSFLIGLVTAYQAAYQLQRYGGNIFIVDMMGISIFRELAPLITAIVIAGRSGSAYTAQIGAMKITQEIDAMRTMGFDPYTFLVLPRIVALVVMLPILIFVADIMAMLGGIIVADLSLDLPPALFIDRLQEVVAMKHFYVGLIKGPFFAFLIASIGIYRGLIVKDDTQSIGYNTTKSVVESLFAVIVCDAVFSIAFTNLGI